MAHLPPARATRRAILAGIATLLPLHLARAQARGATARLGVLMSLRADDAEAKPRSAALLAGLKTLGWQPGGNLQIEWRWAGSDPVLYDRYAAELVALRCDVLLSGSSSPATAALARHTKTVPILFVNVTDPVGQGFVASLAHPGGNITGFSDYDPPMAGKWLELLKQVTPPVSRVAVVFNPDTAPFAGLLLQAIKAAAPSFGLAVEAAPCRNDADLKAAVTGFARERGGGLLNLPDNFTTVHRKAIIALAAQYRLPAVYSARYYAASGGLMSYGIDFDDPFRRVAGYIDRILKGEKPADLPVQAPTKFELVLNLKTAQAQGITIAPSLLATADAVIE